MTSFELMSTYLSKLDLNGTFLARCYSKRNFSTGKKMSFVTSLTFGGLDWIPQFVKEIDLHKCIGCGKCYKACGRNVLQLVGVNEDGEFVEDEDEDDIERQVMVISNAKNCIGCEACARVCPKNCYTHAPLPV
jgi:Nif-specific ferredoxin III